MSKRSESIQIVVLGCGIYGLSTAYYVAQLQGHSHNITIINAAQHPCTGASGHLTAFLSGDNITEPAFDDVIPYSLALHADLASKFDGPARWQCGKVTSYDTDTTAEAPGSSAKEPSEHKRDARPSGFS